jgi:hypothetical protein
VDEVEKVADLVQTSCTNESAILNMDLLPEKIGATEPKTG